MLVSELKELNFRNMISHNLYHLTRIRHGQPAARLFKTARIRGFVLAGILVPERGHKVYRLTAEAQDTLDDIRLKRIRGERA